MISCFQVCVVEKMTIKNKLDLHARMPNGVIFLTPLALFSRGKCQLGSTAKTNFDSSACYMSWSSIVYA